MRGERNSKHRKKENEIWESRRRQYLEVMAKEQNSIDNDSNEEEGCDV